MESPPTLPVDPRFPFDYTTTFDTSPYLAIMEAHEVVEHFFNLTNEGIALATAKTLNESGIACVLWGSSCMRRWGYENSKVLEVGFVVADDKVDQAIETLLEKQPYTRQTVCTCDAPQVCDDWDQISYTMPSKKHLHWVEGKWAKCEEARLQIFGRSELLRMIPMNELPSEYPDTASFAEAIKPDFCLVSDSDLLPPRDDILRLGVGDPGRYPVVMPMPHLILEVEMRLGARYINFSWGGSWERTLARLGWDHPVVDVSKIRHPFLRKVVLDYQKGTKRANRYKLTAYFNEAPYVRVWLATPNMETE